MDNLKTIIIFGGGISGLTAAHELIAKGFNVTLIESDYMLGGMAKSRRELNDVPSEHSWRGYAPFYANTFELMKRIPLKENDVKTVYDHLSLPCEFRLLRDKNLPIKVHVSKLDTAKLGFGVTQYLLSNKRRTELFKQKVVPYYKNKLSNDGYSVSMEFALGPGFGLEKKDASRGHYYHMLKLGKMNQSRYKHNHADNINMGSSKYGHNSYEGWHTTFLPTDEAWIAPWKDYLINKGLTILLNTKVLKLNKDVNPTFIKSCVIENKFDNTQDIISADEYIMCINPYNAVDVFKNSNLPSLSNCFSKLTKNTNSKQISFRIGLDVPINLPNDRMCFVMSDSEFNITWYPQEKHWYPGVNLGINADNTPIKSLWSGSLLDSETPGQLFHKTSTHLTKHQLREEIKYQILRSESFQQLLPNITTDNIIYMEIWYEWEETPEGMLEQSYSKWVTTFENEQYRPVNKTNISNLYLGGAHTKTSMNIWSMEGAVESGKLAANEVCEKYSSPKVNIIEHSDPSWTTPFKIIDDILYDINLPNILYMFMILFIALILIGSYKSIKKICAYKNASTNVDFVESDIQKVTE
jgi:uncharacterized protein with NAD-binding domain and iron-sulfur cluster